MATAQATAEQRRVNHVRCEWHKMRIVAWNLNHRAARHAIPTWVSQAIVAQAPDVVSLTEYVVGPDHERFVEALARTGLGHQQLTPRVGRSNQVLVVAKEPLVSDGIEAPAIHESVPPNFLHVRLVETDMEFIGFRMPAYDKGDRPMKRRTWEWLIEALDAIRTRPALIAGDFNTAPQDSEKRCGDCLERLIERGWALAIPTEGHSWRGPRGREGRQIDYALHTPALQKPAVSYSWAFRELCEDAAAARFGRPDHAMLILDVEPTKGRG